MALYTSTDWNKPAYKEKVRKWSREPVVNRVERPSRLKRARSLGYRAKQGYVIARTRIGKGGRKRPTIRKGRKPSKSGIFFTTEQSLQAIAEKRVARKFPNMEVLNSYYVGESGTHRYYEVILADPNHPAIRADPKINWVGGQRKRVFRGLTSAGKKSRGL
ncbi:MAG: 50S ribosomal protein L15e [Candidatus Aenigmarchaeota archaeon]|nr:50S ribosomal protein L15e [Candidatus Aenigmarchaeota archaeon]